MSSIMSSISTRLSLPRFFTKASKMLPLLTICTFLVKTDITHAMNKGTKRRVNQENMSPNKAKRRALDALALAAQADYDSSHDDQASENLCPLCQKKLSGMSE